MKQGASNSFSFIQPMMALSVPELPVGEWIYEMKIDGYRALAFKADQEVRLVSRNRNSFNDDYPLLVASLKLLKSKSFVIDGEVAALDEHGRPSFQLLQSYGSRKHTPLVYYAFDLLRLEGSDLRSRPLIERRELLANLLKKAPANINVKIAMNGAEGMPFAIHCDKCRLGYPAPVRASQAQLTT